MRVAMHRLTGFVHGVGSTAHAGHVIRRGLLEPTAHGPTDMLVLYAGPAQLGRIYH